MKTLLIRHVPDDLHARIVAAAKSEDRTITAWITRLLERETRKGSERITEDIAKRNATQPR